jgi:hypothetical protein
MTDDELLRVAAERETLVTDAVIAIDTELARRVLLGCNRDEGNETPGA